MEKEQIRQAAKDYADRKVQFLTEKMDSRAKNIHNLRSRDFQAGAEWAINFISLNTPVSSSKPEAKEKCSNCDAMVEMVSEGWFCPACFC